MKFGNNHVVLELFGIWVRQETSHEANSLYRCTRHATELQLLVVLRAAPTGTMGNGAAAAGGTVLALGHGLKVQCERKSKLQEAWMGNHGKGEGSLCSQYWLMRKDR